MIDERTRDDLLSDRRMAYRLGVPISWLRGELDAGRLPGIAAGSRWLVHAPTIERVLAERAAHAAATLEADDE